MTNLTSNCRNTHAVSLIMCTFVILCFFFPSLHSIQALADCAKDLLSPFQSDNIDLVAGMDAMGFILGKKAKNFTFRGKIQGEFRETKE